MVFRRQRTGYVDVPLPSGDTLQGTWTGGLPRGGVGLVGVQVRLTDRHLIVTPLDLSQATRLLETLGNYVPVAGTIAELAGDVMDAGGLQQSAVVPLSEIRSVEAQGRASLFKPPAVRIVLQDGSEATIGILKGIGTPNIHPGNNQQRDTFVARLGSAIGAG